MPRHSVGGRAREFVRRVLARKEPTSHQKGLRLVRGVPLVAAIEKDRVVREQLRLGQLSLDAVRTAWYHQRNFEDERPLWRVLVDVQGVDSTSLFRSAAGLYHFDHASVSMLGTAILIDGNRTHLAPAAWKKLVEMGVFPVREQNDPLDYGVRWTFASFDPARPAVQQYLTSTMRHPYQLRFLEPAVLFQLMDACFDIEHTESIAWYRKYVLGKKPIALVVTPENEQLRRAA